MPQRVRCILYMGAVTALIGLTPVHCQQQPAESKTISRQQPGGGSPNAAQPQPAPNEHPSRSARPVPAAQYSPLAAQGGYRGQKMTWYEALFHSLNPKNVDWGMRWEQRRSIFLENSIGNKYFMYTAALSLLLVYCFVIIVWQRWNHAERLKQLAQRAADAMNYAKYWKQGADKAIRKHNAHIEKCNRVIEAGENGLPVGDTGEAMDLRLQLDRMRAEVQNVMSEKLRLQGELNEKAKTITELSLRVDEAAKKLGNGNYENGAPATMRSEDKAALVARINRLESALAAATQENRRLKGA